MVKVVYFDEESASDYLDISAGGKAASTTEAVKQRTAETHAKVQAGLTAKLSWLPFLGASGEVSGGAEAALAGTSILNKTLSNTILTDYLAQVGPDPRVAKLRELQVAAPEGSMAYAKMFTPYLVMLKIEEMPLDLARLDEVLVAAKGYYELVGESDKGERSVLRFNLRAFRNNYGLIDLGRMHLVFHGIHVGQTSEEALTMEAEMSAQDAPMTAAEIVDGASSGDELLDVYDIILAGVEHAG